MTEVLALLFERLDPTAKRSFLHQLMNQNACEKFDAAIDNLERAALFTQVNLGPAGRGKRPDMVLRCDGRDILVIEAKLGASIARHVDDAPSAAIDFDPIPVHQLQTYGRWISGRNNHQDAWPGGVILLTAWTMPPDGFAVHQGDDRIEAVATWSDVATWLSSKLASLDIVARSLASDFFSFLREKRLLDRNFNTRDLSALTLYAASEDAFRHTFRTVMKGVRDAYPKLGSFRHSSVGLDGDKGVFWGWIYLDAPFQRRNSRLYVAVGVCAEPGTGFDAATAEQLRAEPFFLVYFGDEYEKQKPAEFLSDIPSGWLVTSLRSDLIVTRPVREFSGETDRRAEELSTWANAEIGKLVNQLKAASA